MSFKELYEIASSISSATTTDTQAISDRFHEEFDAATTVDQRSALLAMFKTTMDARERHIAKTGAAEQLAAFQKGRICDYTSFIAQESEVDGTVSPDMLVAVTNREIAAGRMTEDDPMRLAAVNAAAVPHPSHAELLAKAEAKNKATISIERLLNELKFGGAKSVSGAVLMDARERIVKEFDAAVTSEQRSALLAMYTVLMDQVERNLASQGDKAKELADFRGARAYEYKALIYKECFVGLDTPVVGADVSVEMLKYVTDREIAAGRMTEDHSARQLAVTASAAPHLTHAQLLERHAKLKAEAGQSTAAAALKTAPSSAAVAYGVGATLGKKLKGLFRK
jgi:hypothetical protein